MPRIALIGAGSIVFATTLLNDMLATPSLSGSEFALMDLNRDKLWQAMEKLGLAGVSLISLDSVWSAMRFRPLEKVGKKAKN